MGTKKEKFIDNHTNLSLKYKIMESNRGTKISSCLSLIILLLANCDLIAQTSKVGDEITVTTLKGERVSGKISKLDGAKVVIIYSGGGSAILLTNLTRADQLKLGYDAAAIAQKSQDDLNKRLQKERDEADKRELRDSVYNVEITPNDKSKPEEGQSCIVTFSGKLPRPAAVDKILRSALGEAVKQHPSQDILARAYLGDDDLTRHQFHGNLIYKQSENKILTDDEWRGVKKIGADIGTYYLEISEERTFKGITPEVKWLTLSLVFPQEPSPENAYEYAIAEVTKATNRNMKINAGVFVGDKSDTTTWNRLKDADGVYVFVEYDLKNKNILKGSTGKSEFVKHVP